MFLFEGQSGLWTFCCIHHLNAKLLPGRGSVKPGVPAPIFLNTPNMRKISAVEFKKVHPPIDSWLGFDSWSLEEREQR